MKPPPGHGEAEETSTPTHPSFRRPWPLEAEEEIRKNRSKMKKLRKPKQNYKTTRKNCTRFYPRFKSAGFSWL